MKLFVKFVTKSMDVLETMRDPSKLAAKMSEYSNPTDPELLQLQQLLNLAEASKDAAAAQANFNNLQKFIFNREMGKELADGASARPPCLVVGCGLLRRFD
jgi:hypothetical protein